MSTPRPLTMTPEHETCLREAARNEVATHWGVKELCAELDATRAKLAEVEAELAEMREVSVRANGPYIWKKAREVHGAARLAGMHDQQYVTGGYGRTEPGEAEEAILLRILKAPHSALSQPHAREVEHD